MNKQTKGKNIFVHQKETKYKSNKKKESFVGHLRKEQPTVITKVKNAVRRKKFERKTV